MQQLREKHRIKEPDGTYRTVREHISCGVLDRRCLTNEGGTPIAEAFFKSGAKLPPGDNPGVSEFGAVSGWGQVRGRLLGNVPCCGRLTDGS